MKFQYFIFFVLYVLSSGISKAQTITILNASTGEPIENIALYNASRSTSILSDPNGKANITYFADSDSIFFQHPAFTSRGYLKPELVKMKKIYLSKKIIRIDEFVISASKYIENKRDVANMTDALDANDLGNGTAMNAAEILSMTGNLTVQKTQGGGGSPVIRGFEANKILLVIDGVRMNNAIYRSGHIQNAITIDNDILERVEVIYGPSSLIYGSDALGGVVHYYTRDPQLCGESGKSMFKLNANTQYSSANSGKTGHIDFNLGGLKFASLSSISYKDFGDIQMGKKGIPSYGDYGKIMHYVSRINRADSTVVNPNPYLQKNTAYSQIDLLQKFRFSPSRYFDFIVNLQYSTSTRIDRLDFLNDYNSAGTNLAYASYYYGPQNRLFSSIKAVVKKDNFFFTNMTSTLAYQRIDEDRFTRKFGRNNLLAQKEDVHVLTFNQDYLKLLAGKQFLSYGIEATYNRALSTASYTNISDNSASQAQTRYPDGGTDAWSFASYLSWKKAFGEKYNLAGGFRYQYASYHSGFISNILPYSEITIANPALTGSLSLVYHPSERWQVNTVVSTGFRSPNVDDYGKVRAKDGEVTVPNPDLKPEYSYNFELGVIRNIEGFASVGATGYYTYLTNAIVRTGYSSLGFDSLLYDGDMYRMITNSNASRAYIRGLSFAISSDEFRNLHFRSTLNVTAGRDITSNEPMAHIPPVFGRTSVQYQLRKFTGEVFIDYNGWKHISDFSPLGEDNESEATADGYPAWYTLNIHTGYRINEAIQFQFAVENLLDKLYKTFASGIAMPGRSFIFKLKISI